MTVTSKIDPKDIRIDYITQADILTEGTITYIPENLTIDIFKKISVEQAQELIGQRLKVLYRLRKSIASGAMRGANYEYTCASCDKPFDIQDKETLYCPDCFEKLYLDERNHDNPLRK